MADACAICSEPLTYRSTDGGKLCSACARAELGRLSDEASSALRTLALAAVVGAIGLAAGVLLNTAPHIGTPVLYLFLVSLFFMGAKTSKDFILSAHRQFHESGQSSFIFKIVMFLFAIQYYVLLVFAIIAMAWFQAVLLTLRQIKHYLNSLKEQRLLQLQMNAVPEIPVSDGSLALQQTRRAAPVQNLFSKSPFFQRSNPGNSTNAARLHTTCEPIQYMRRRPDA